MNRNLREDIIVQADFIARTAFKFPVFKFTILDFRQETERSIGSYMPAGDVFHPDAKTHAHAGFAHERHTGTETQFKYETILQPVTAAFGVCIFIQTLFFFKLFTRKEILFLGRSHTGRRGFDIFIFVIVVGDVPDIFFHVRVDDPERVLQEVYKDRLDVRGFGFRSRSFRSFNRFFRGYMRLFIFQRRPTGFCRRSPSNQTSQTHEQQQFFQH